MGISVKNIILYLPLPCSLDRVLCNFWLFPSQNDHVKGKHFESVQDFEAAITAQLRHSRKGTFRTAPESVKNKGITVSKVRGINGNVWFSYQSFQKFEH